MEQHSTSDLLHAELVAVLVSVVQGQPRVLTLAAGDALPQGPFQMVHRSLQSGLRLWVESQTGHRLGYVEQLYTFADRERSAQGPVLSISYLALTREADSGAATSPQQALAVWRDWYGFFPWEDWRQGEPAILPIIYDHLQAWISEAPDAASAQHRHARVAIHFGWDGHAWNEDLVLQRYELLYEAGMVEEAVRRGATLRGPGLGASMVYDHRRMLATGIARLRAKIKYRPVVFELMPESFTLLQLQQTVEALAGRGLHKQNFRRQMDQQALVEETGASTEGTTGRPAKLFRFRSDVLLERATSGSKLPLAKSA